MVHYSLKPLLYYVEIRLLERLTLISSQAARTTNFYVRKVDTPNRVLRIVFFIALLNLINHHRAKSDFQETPSINAQTPQLNPPLLVSTKHINLKHALFLFVVIIMRCFFAHP